MKTLIDYINKTHVFLFMTNFNMKYSASPNLITGLNTHMHQT